MVAEDKLAIDGGPPVISDPIPFGVSGPSVVDEEEVEAVSEVLRSQELFRYDAQSQCHQFEKEASELLGVGYTLIVTSGTAALVCAMKGVGLGPGDEAIVSGYTYIATPAAIIATGAVPVIAEIDDSLGLDPYDVEKKITSHTKAIVVTHMRGVPARLDQILDIAKRHGLKVVEDCCQIVGGQHKGKAVGSKSDAAAWSLNYFKTISTGEGGMAYTNDRDVYERILYCSDPGLPMWNTTNIDMEKLRSKSENVDMEKRDTPQGQFYDVEYQLESFPGEGYRASELIGAVGRVQLGKLPKVLEHQRKLKRAFMSELDEARSYKHQYVDDSEGDTGVSAGVIVNDEDLAKGFAHALKAEGVEVAAIFNEGIPDRHIYSAWESILNKRSHHPSGYPWKDPSYKGDVEYSKDMCPNTLNILGRTLLFNFHMNMTEEQAKLMARALNKVDASLGI